MYINGTQDAFRLFMGELRMFFTKSCVFGLGFFFDPKWYGVRGWSQLKHLKLSKSYRMYIHKWHKGRFRLFMAELRMFFY
jgi:hypothetical protein